MTEEQKLLALNTGLATQVLRLRESARTWRHLTQISGMMNIVLLIGIVVAMFYPIIECVTR